MTWLFDVVLWPVQALDAGIQAFLLGIPAAVLALVIFRYASDQTGIETAKERIKGYLIELWLYRDDLWVTLLALGHILGHNVTYLRHALLPMAIMIVPFLLMLIQIESRFAFRALEPGETAVLTLALDGDTRVSQLPIELRLPAGLVPETPPLRIDATGEVTWRLRAEAVGAHDVQIVLGDERVAKTIRVGGNGVGVATELYRPGDWNALLYPQEPALDANGTVSALTFSYPRAGGEWLGLSSASWMFFLSSILFGFALRGLFGVTF
jgi:hypothetical protein